MKLLMLPRGAVRNPSVSKARWLLAGGTALLAIQFLLQYRLGLRSRGVTEAVMLNIAIFIPCSALFSLGQLYLQRQGSVKMIDKIILIPTWIIAMILLFLGMEAIASAVYAMMQFYFSARLLRQLHQIRRTLANYYDSDMDHMLRWMHLSYLLLTLMAAMVPIVIFAQGPLLAIFSSIFFFGIFYMVDSFCLYAVSNAPMKVKEAEESEEEVSGRQDTDDETGVSSENMQRVEGAVSSWTQKGGHLQSGLKLPNAADEIGVPRYLLSAWLHQKGLRYNDWLTELRIDEAKHIMKEHPEWSNEAIAQQCGFSDRSYFQKKFKDITGVTPAQYISRIPQDS